MTFSSRSVIIRPIQNIFLTTECGDADLLPLYRSRCRKPTLSKASDTYLNPLKPSSLRTPNKYQHHIVTSILFLQLTQFFSIPPYRGTISLQAYNQRSNLKPEILLSQLSSPYHPFQIQIKPTLQRHGHRQPESSDVQGPIAKLWCRTRCKSS